MEEHEGADAAQIEIDDQVFHSDIDLEQDSIMTERGDEVSVDTGASDVEFIDLDQPPADEDNVQFEDLTEEVDDVEGVMEEETEHNDAMRIAASDGVEAELAEYESGDDAETDEPSLEAHGFSEPEQRLGQALAQASTTEITELEDSDDEATAEAQGLAPEQPDVVEDPVVDEVDKTSNNEADKIASNASESEAASPNQSGEEIVPAEAVREPGADTEKPADLADATAADEGKLTHAVDSEEDGDAEQIYFATDQVESRYDRATDARPKYDFIEDADIYQEIADDNSSEARWVRIDSDDDSDYDHDVGGAFVDTEGESYDEGAAGDASSGGEDTGDEPYVPRRAKYPDGNFEESEMESADHRVESALARSFGTKSPNSTSEPKDVANAARKLNKATIHASDEEYMIDAEDAAIREDEEEDDPEGAAARAGRISEAFARIPVLVKWEREWYPLAGAENSLLDAVPSDPVVLETFFEEVRARLPDEELPDDREIILEMPQLGLRLGEDNLYSSKTTLLDMMRLLRLSSDGGRELRIEVTHEPRFITRLNALFEQLEDLQWQKKAQPPWTQPAFKRRHSSDSDDDISGTAAVRRVRVGETPADEEELEYIRPPTLSLHSAHAPTIFVGRVHVEPLRGEDNRDEMATPAAPTSDYESTSDEDHKDYEIST